ncbi:MAG: pitrilysin family protein [Kiritimatiellia bacterium]|nr:pitrilysin family protein [Kiritimatiellia bacterium]
MKKTADKMMEVRETRLGNGIRVVTAELPRVQSMAIGIWVGVGGRYESMKLSGISHFIEHLLFKGTEKRSARDISRAIEGRGGFCNAFTQEESTCYYARVAYDHAWKVLDILGDMYLHPRFDQADIDREKSVIMEEIMMYRDQPEHVVQEMLIENLWRDHELGRPLIGSPETLKNINRDQIIAFKRKKYVPEATVLTFTGKVDHAECVKIVAQLMGRIRPASAPSYRLVTAAVPQHNLALKGKEIEQTHMALGFRIFGRHDKRRYALKILNVILGENMSSRLFQTIREKNGLAYSIGSGAQLFAETGALVINAGLDRNRRAKAIELILREIKRLKDELISLKELSMAKQYVIGHLRLALENPLGQMMWVGEHILNYGSVIPPEEVVGAITAVRAEDVQKTAEAIFKDRLATFSMLSPGVSEQEHEALNQMLGTLS